MPCSFHWQFLTQISLCPSINVHLRTVKYKAVQGGMVLSINTSKVLFILFHPQTVPASYPTPFARDVDGLNTKRVEDQILAAVVPR